MRDRVRDFAAHGGKISGDEPLLAECDRQFASYRVGPVMLADIRVRNSELLEIRAMYFRRARKIIGCGAAPACTNRAHDGSRIVPARDVPRPSARSLRMQRVLT